jgi:hypothetical protein
VIDVAFDELVAATSIKQACALLGKSRATHYRRLAPPVRPAPGARMGRVKNWNGRVAARRLRHPWRYAAVHATIYAAFLLLLCRDATPSLRLIAVASWVPLFVVVGVVGTWVAKRRGVTPIDWSSQEKSPMEEDGRKRRQGLP